MVKKTPSRIILIGIVITAMWFITAEKDWAKLKNIS